MSKMQHQRISMDRRTALLAVGAAALTGCGGGGSAPAEAPTEPTGQVTISNLRSESNGWTYTIHVYVPQGYATGTAALPAIYVTEGDAPYGSGWPAVTRFDAFKQVMQRRSTQAILVGISGTAQRGTDFLLPGATHYLRFISRELAPAIERQYRANPQRRALTGLSHGGYFVVAALVLEGLEGSLSFSHYLSTESSFGAHADPFAYRAYVAQLDGKALPTTLFLTGARNGNGPNVVTPLYNQMAAQNHPGLNLLRAEYDTTHVGADAPAFEDALARFFS